MLCVRRKLGGCSTDIKIIEKHVILSVSDKFRKIYIFVTALQIKECTTDVEMIIQEMIKAIHGTFPKIEFSSESSWRKCVFPCMRPKLGGCTKEIEIIPNRRIELFTVTFGKSSFLVTHHGPDQCNTHIEIIVKE